MASEPSLPPSVPSSAPAVRKTIRHTSVSVGETVRTTVVRKSEGPKHEPESVPVPPPLYLWKTFLGAISIGSTAAMVGAYYITLSVTFGPEQLSPFLAVLAAAVVASIGVVASVHVRVTHPLDAWMRTLSEEIPLEAWRSALNYPALLAMTVGLSALGVTGVVAGYGLYLGGFLLGSSVLVGGLLASVLDSVFVYLFAEHHLTHVRRAMSLRVPSLPVVGEGILVLPLRLQLILVIVSVTVVGAVVSGSLAYRGAALMLEQSTSMEWLALRLVLVTLVSLSVTLGGCLLVVRQAAGPLVRMSNQLQGLTPEHYRIRFPIVGTNEVSVLSHTINLMLAGLEEREFIKDVFGRYLSRQISDVILQGHLRMGGELVNITVLMSDIRDFTPLSESLEAPRVVELLNRYFTAMVEICMENGGVVDKFIGDALMVIYGAPVHLPPEESSLRAVRTAWQMRNRLARLNAEFAAEGIPPLRIGIGIHNGDAVVGNVGSAQRMDYTCIGDTVNTTARVESACKELKTDILISSQIQSLLGDRIVTGPGSRVELKGKKEPVQVFSLLTVLDKG